MASETNARAELILGPAKSLDLSGHVTVGNAVMIGQAGSADVFEGDLRVSGSPLGNALSKGDQKVAIKRLRAHLRRNRALEQLLEREMVRWAKLGHPNVIRFVGFTLENDYPSIVCEWMEYGTLNKYIRKHSGYDKTKIALGIARGINYLHQNGVIHTDLKADNVMMNEKGEPVICDYGMSRVAYHTQSFIESGTYENLKKTTRWLAIELLNSNAVHTKESDVWALGMTVYEVITRGLPYARLRTDTSVVMEISRGRLPDRPDSIDSTNAVQALWRLCQDCWKLNPKRRPTAETITSRLESGYYSQVSSSTSILQRFRISFVFRAEEIKT